MHPCVAHCQVAAALPGVLARAAADRRPQGYLPSLPLHTLDMLEMETVVEPRDLAEPTSRFEPSGVALVTGAAGGIGRATAYDFAAVGVDVALADRRPDPLAAVDAAIEEAFDVAVHSVVGDVTDREAVARIVGETVDQLDALDVLVNAAGTAMKQSTSELSPDAWDLVQDVNLKAPHLTAKAAHPHLRDGGSIVNLSSTVGRYGSPWMSHYATAKAGVRQLTRSLATEWADDDVRVNAVAPGPILTPTAAQNFEPDANAALAARVGDRSVVDRDIGAVEEVADVIRFLASPAASHITGQTLPVAGVPPSIEDVSVARDE